MAHIDYKQIALCLRSLLANSMEAVTAGGEIRIRTRVEGDEIVVEIADNGGDVSPEAREALATPFPATEELGSGVGLPLCRSILARQGLSFTMESGPTGWTRYLLKLPRRKEDI